MISCGFHGSSVWREMRCQVLRKGGNVVTTHSSLITTVQWWVILPSHVYSVVPFYNVTSSPQYNSFRYARLKGREGGEGGKGGVEEGKWGQVVTRDSDLIQLTPSGFFSFQNRGEHNCNANTTKFNASERLNWLFRRKPRYFGLLACWENAHETQFPILPLFVNRALLHFVSFRFKELKAS